MSSNISRKSFCRNYVGRPKETEASLPPLFILRSARPLPEPSRRMREQGVDEAGLRGEVAAQHLGAALVARALVEQALELGDVAVDRLLEVTVGAIFAGDLVEGLLSRRRIEPLGESLALAALIAIPHFGGEVAIHQAADVERQRLQRIAAGGRLGRGAPRGLAVAATGVGAAQQIGQPSVAPLVGACGRDRRRFGAARGGPAEVRRRKGRRAAGNAPARRPAGASA